MTELGAPKHISFFGDASSRDKTYMVAGGFAVAGNRISEVENAIANIRDEAGIRSEFHWADYRGGGRQAGYEELIRYAFHLINKKHAALHVIVAKFEGYDHKAVDGENKDTSINRMYYQLLLHKVARKYGRRRIIHVRLDAGNDSKDICNMRHQLCADAYRKYDALPNCVRSIEPAKSDKSGIIQMADVVLGGIAAHCNEVKHTSAKGELADFILRASGRHSWRVSTAQSASFLTVWHHVSRL